jgi:hypothetical protein
MDNKGRSPRYPSVGLGEAIERIRTLYEKEHHHKTDKEVVAKDLGYAGLNGASLGMIASLKQYGLLESVGDGLRVSDDAVTISELPIDSQERLEAIQRVAFAPKIFTELYGHFGDKLPSDENLRLYLVKKGFNSNAADIVIRTFHDTISLVKEEAQGYNAAVSNEPQRPAGLPSMDFHRAMAKQSATGAAFDLLNQGNAPTSVREGLNFQVTDNSINISFNGSVTQEIIRKLIKHLEINVDDFPTREQLDKERRDNLVKAFTTDSASGKPYAEGKSKDEIESLLDNFNQVNNGRGE